MVAPLPAAAGVTSVLQSVVPLIAAGVAEPGSVDAPAWVLPLGAFAVILTAGVIPLVLKVGLSREASNMTQTWIMPTHLHLLQLILLFSGKKKAAVPSIEWYQ